MLRLNLGCGYNIKPANEGWVNVDVDRHEGVDYLWDLENFPWPWSDDSVDEVLMSHILEHLGETTDAYLRIWKELYRVCKNGAEITIIVPHPRHDNFIGDPTHVRAITPDALNLFDKKKCEEWIKQGYSNTPLALYLGVNFEMKACEGVFEDQWKKSYETGEISFEELQWAVKTYNNVVKQYGIILKTIK